jgi:hypothetical protein
LQVFLAGGIVAGYRPQTVGYHPPRRTPPAYRPPGNEPFCRAFSFPLIIAVGAVGIVASSTDGLSSLSVYPSAGTLSMHLPSDYIYPYRCVCRICSHRRIPKRGRDNSARRRLVCASEGSRRQASRWWPLTASRSLDFHLSSDYHSCSKCFFWPRLTGSGPKGTVGRNPTIGVT